MKPWEASAMLCMLALISFNLDMDHNRIPGAIVAASWSAAFLIAGLYRFFKS